MQKINERFANPGSLARYLRVHKGLSQQAVARACSLWPSEVSRFERGWKNIGTQRAVRMAEFLGASIDDLAYDRYANVLETLPSPKRDPALRRRQQNVQKIKDKLGQDGEAYVARLEREKLAGTPYANGVNEA